MVTREKMKWKVATRGRMWERGAKNGRKYRERRKGREYERVEKKEEELEENDSTRTREER